MRGKRPSFLDGFSAILLIAFARLAPLGTRAQQQSLVDVERGVQAACEFIEAQMQGEVCGLLGHFLSCFLHSFIDNFPLQGEGSACGVLNACEYTSNADEQCAPEYGKGQTCSCTGLKVSKSRHVTVYPEVRIDPLITPLPDLLHSLYKTRFLFTCVMESHH
jgi:hypothetical protein